MRVNDIETDLPKGHAMKPDYLATFSDERLGRLLWVLVETPNGDPLCVQLADRVRAEMERRLVEKETDGSDDS